MLPRFPTIRMLTYVLFVVDALSHDQFVLLCCPTEFRNCNLVSTSLAYFPCCFHFTQHFQYRSKNWQHWWLCFLFDDLATVQLLQFRVLYSSVSRMIRVMKIFIIVSVPRSYCTFDFVTVHWPDRWVANFSISACYYFVALLHYASPYTPMRRHVMRHPCAVTNRIYR